ncbi:MAG: hypothetical protein Q9178_000412 [Gyalolechia marmorata]
MALLKVLQLMARSNTNGQSALYGRPPVTDNDYWIVKALLFAMGLVDADPVNGLPFEQFPPLSDESRSGSIIAGVTISIFLIVSVTATRLVARKTIRTSSLGWDDALITAATVAGLESIAEIMQWFTAGFTKFAIIFFNARLTGSTSKMWSWIHRACFVVVLAWLITGLYVATLSCKPYAATYSLIVAGKTAPDYKCNGNNTAIGLSLQILHALLDWILLAVPAVILVRLKMPWQRKVQCIIPLSIGTLSAVGACKRIHDAYHPHEDISCKTVPIHLTMVCKIQCLVRSDYFAAQLPWSIVDIVCAICATSLPAMNNLVVHHLPKHLSRHWSGGDPGSSPSGGITYSSHETNPSDPKGGSSSGFAGSFDDTKQIIVQRDIDWASLRTEAEENPDPSCLELNELNSDGQGKTTP